MNVIGVDLGGTKILARSIDVTTSKAKKRVKSPTPKDGPDAVLDEIAAVVAEVDPDRGCSLVGVGVPGLLDEKGVVSQCPNIDGWDGDVDVKTGLETRLERTVVVANDVNCGAVAEHRFGAGIGTPDMLAVFVGTGVGGGLIIDNQLRVGARGMAGEIGHVTVTPNGRRCGCGGRGHLESYAGRAGIEAEARRRAASGEPNALVTLAQTGKIKSRHIEQALAEGDSVAHELLSEAVEALATGIGNLATALDLERVVLGGGVVDKLGQPFVDRIAKSAAFGGFGSRTCELRLAERLDDAGVLGAAIIAAERTP